jgi:hypothetical protein
MTELLIFIVTAYGASNIMVFSTIFKKWRNFVGTDNEEPNFFGKLFGCMMCLPFWWGIILSVFMFSPTLSTGLMHNFDVLGFFSIDKELLAAFFDGCLASGSVWFVHTVQEKLEA